MRVIIGIGRIVKILAKNVCLTHMADAYGSYQTPITSGVSQGSVLGPLLFLIYINDLSNSITSTIRLFVDDRVVYKDINNATDLVLLQQDLTTMGFWCHKWQLKTNTIKCKQMTITTNVSH